MRYLQENVVNFNGSVYITPIMPVTYLSRPLVCPSQGGVAVIVDWECIEAMALIYRQRALQANASGHANYTSIQRSFIEVSTFCLHLLENNSSAWRRCQLNLILSW